MTIKGGGAYPVQYRNPLTGITSDCSYYIDEQGNKKDASIYKFFVEGEWVTARNAPHNRETLRKYSNTKRGFMVALHRITRNRLKKRGKLIIETSNANKALRELYNSVGYKKFTTLYRRVIYSETAIKCLLKQVGFNNIDVQHQQRYRLSNHLGWLVYNNTGNEISMFDDNQLNKIYSNILIKNKLSDGLYQSLNHHHDNSFFND